MSYLDVSALRSSLGTFDEGKVRLAVKRDCLPSIRNWRQRVEKRFGAGFGPGMGKIRAPKAEPERS